VPVYSCVANSVALHKCSGIISKKNKTKFESKIMGEKKSS